MLNTEQLRPILENKYNRDDWYKILRQNFNVDVLRDNPPPIIAVTGNEFNAIAYELGEFDTTDGFKVGIYEVDVPGVKQIYRNKVGLRKLLQNVYTTTVDAALIVFTQGDKWRFSYVSEVTTRNPDTGIRESVKTDAKRYTYLFGKNEKAKTAADRFANIQQEDVVSGRRTTLKALQDTFNVEKMSKDFFNEYRKHYGAFLSYLIGENEDGKVSGTAAAQFKTIFNADDKRARDFVKKMLGRIVFLYFLEKKGWMGVPENESWGKGDPDFLRNLFNDSNNQASFYPLVLEPLFHETLNEVREGDFFAIDESLFNKKGYNKLKIPFLNGGLFEAETYKTDFLVFPAELFKNLFTFFDRFNFTVHEDSPEEHTVAVDPEMLGHIFENLLEDNKDKGAFYTPKEIVHYMCQESLIEYLCTKCKTESDEELRDGLDRFIKNQELSGIAGYEEAILVALRDVKICDPAIGSGAFPMGILLEIFHAVETLNFAIEDTTERVWSLEGGWNPAKVKLSIIENSIYGVDIEAGAVDIARLRFWLSLVVDEITPTPLPNLDYKIVVGNSLISKFEDEVIDIDWEVAAGTAATKQRQFQIQDNLKKLLNKQKQFFSYKGDKKKLQSEIRGLKIDVLISQLELDKYKYGQTTAITGNLFEQTTKEKQKSAGITIQLSGYQNAIKRLESLKKTPDKPLNFFDWKLNFPEVLNPVLKIKGDLSSTIGFDIVIGNPPYLGSKEIGALNQQQYKNKYGFSDDMYNYFYLEAIAKAKNKGTIAYITSNTFLTLGSKSTLRKTFQNNRIIELVNVGYVFDSAFVDTVILVMNKELTNGTNYQFKYKNAIKSFKEAITYTAKIEWYREALNNVFFTPNDVNLSLYHKLSPHLNRLHNTYWSLIGDTKSRVKNSVELKEYCDGLQETDLTFLGLITEGAQGLVTGNNSKYLGVICDSEKEEVKILKTLADKLVTEGVSLDCEVSLKNKDAIYQLAERLKKRKANPSLFGKFFLYRTVSPSDVVEFENLSLENQLNGCERDVWVNYNRGNESGYKWNVPYKECIKWDKNTVKELRESTVTNSRWQGANYYNTSGFGWVDYFTNELKGFFIEPSPYSKNVVKMHSVSSISDKYILALLNSKLGTYYIKNFITTTHTLQINDGKLFPILIHRHYQKQLEDLVDKILMLKISGETLSIKDIENKINSVVYRIYNLTFEEAKSIDAEFALTKNEYTDEA